MTAPRKMCLVLPPQSFLSKRRSQEVIDWWERHGNSKSVTLYSHLLPNLKGKGAYYVWCQGEDRVHHIRSVSREGTMMILEPGNSFVLPRIPELTEADFKTQWFTYAPLSAFGLKQVSPGVLIDITDDLPAQKPAPSHV